MDDRCVDDGAGVDSRMNLDHVLKDSRAEAFLMGCVIQKTLKTDRRE